jgi:hypothetical protein
VAARLQNDEADILYGAGILIYANWEVIVTTRVGYEKSYIQAQQSALVAKAQWEQALGKELGK